jgi:hypothetical protein
MWIVLPSTCSVSSPESVGSTLESGEPFHALAQSVTWRGKPMRLQHWRAAWKRAPWMRRLSGVMLSPSTASHGVAAWISSLAASPVRISALQERARGSRGSAPVCGSTSLASFAQWSPDLSSWKTSQLSLFGGSMLCSETWPLSGLMRRGMCFELRTWALRTLVPGSSFSPIQQRWPTPMVKDAQSAARGTTQTQIMHPGVTLTDAMRKFPTPAARDYRQANALEHEGHEDQLPNFVAKMFPTPAACQYGQNQGGAMGKVGPIRDSLETLARSGKLPFPPSPLTATDGANISPDSPKPRLPSLVLNPCFVEALMGLPIGWTDCERAVMPSCRSKRRSPSTCSLSGSE